MTNSAGEAPQGSGPTISSDDTVVSELPTAAAPPPGARRPKWLPWAVLGALAAVAVAVVLVLGLSSGSSDDGSAAYQAKVAAVMAPVISANKQLSTSLATLRGTRATTAKRKVVAAQSAMLSARGGLAALTVPKGSEQLALNARQTLTRQSGYLQAVATALSNPASASAGQAQTLASNLTGALDVIAPTGQDWSTSVTGSDTLTAWAPKAVAAIKHKKQVAANKRKRSAPNNNGSGASAPAATSTANGGSDCGGGLHAGPDTSCPFAQSVQSAYNQAPGSSATVTAYSPTTGRTYTMSCRPAGTGITCSGGNNASVTWGY
ncbi:MAG: hypothetical protein JWR30_3750 [Conexibacter sp.]|nr:hypothetical protein [Conexibacter sp.]